jgi:hypothetical protein
MQKTHQTERQKKTRKCTYDDRKKPKVDERNKNQTKERTNEEKR